MVYSHHESYGHHDIQSCPNESVHAEWVFVVPCLCHVLYILLEIWTPTYQAALVVQWVGYSCLDRGEVWHTQVSSFSLKTGLFWVFLIFFCCCLRFTSKHCKIGKKSFLGKSIAHDFSMSKSAIGGSPGKTSRKPVPVGIMARLSSAVMACVLEKCATGLFHE